MSINGAQVSSPSLTPSTATHSIARPPMPATPKVGRATSISSRAAEMVRAMTMTGGESRSTSVRPGPGEPAGYLRREELRVALEEERAVNAFGVEPLAGEVVVEDPADLGQATAAARPGPAVGADLDRRASAGVDGRADLPVGDALAMANPHGLPHPPSGGPSLRRP